MDDRDIRKVSWDTIGEAFNLSVTSGSTMIWQAQSYTVTTLPAAATYPRAVIYVSNEAGGATLAFSDGSNWRRVQDRNVVS